MQQKDSKIPFLLTPAPKKNWQPGETPGKSCINMHFTGPIYNGYTFYMQIRYRQPPAAHRLPLASDLSEVCFQPVGSTPATCYVRSRDLSEAFRTTFGRFFPPQKRQFFCQYFAIILTLFHITTTRFKIRKRHLHQPETSHSRTVCQTKCHFVRRPKNLARTFHVPELFTTFVA